MNRPLNIVVAGYIIGFPLGGFYWFAADYLLALKRMGHNVLFLEDSGNWAYPFDPVRGTYDVDSSYGREALEAFMARIGLSGRWCYYNAFEDQHYGLSKDELKSFLASADAMINVSGVLPHRDHYFTVRNKIFLDTDPVWTQLKLSQKQADLDYAKLHDHFFTYGYNLPKGHTPVPLSGLDWKPTTPAVLLPEWTPAPGPGTHYTTIGNWDVRDREIEVAGKRYSWRKAVEYEKIFDLPKRVPDVAIELCYAGMEEDRDAYMAAGWKWRNGMEVSVDPWVYMDFVKNSRAEFTVAKQQNIELKSGWVSDRGSCYLGAGRPLITQDCGYDWLPVGEGLLTFHDTDSAVAAIESVERDYEKHRKAARAIAEEYFDAQKVVGNILKESGL